MILYDFLLIPLVLLLTNTKVVGSFHLPPGVDTKNSGFLRWWWKQWEATTYSSPRSRSGIMLFSAVSPSSSQRSADPSTPSNSNQHHQESSSSSTVTGIPPTFTCDDDIFLILDKLAQTMTTKRNRRQRPPRPWVRRNNNGTTEKHSSCNTRTCNYVLKQLANSHRPDAGYIAERVLRYMLKESGRRPEILPDVVTLNTVLGAYAKSEAASNEERLRNADSARNLFFEWHVLCGGDGRTSTSTSSEHQHHALLTKEDDVDRVSYNTIIGIMGKAGIPEEAETFFSRLERRYEKTSDKNFEPDSYSYACLLHSYALAGDSSKVGTIFQKMQKRRDDDGNDDGGGGLKPTIHSYNEVLYAYSKSNNPSAAEEFLQWWIEEESCTVIMPDTRSYNIVLHSMAKATKMRSNSNNNSNNNGRKRKKIPAEAAVATAERAQRLFDSIPRPDEISYTTLISAMASVPGKAALSSVGRVIDRAWRDGYIQIDSSFISNVLYSLALNDHRSMPTFAQALVRDMIVRGLPVDLPVYNALIFCWASSNDRDGPRRVVQLLEELESREGMDPDVKTYANVMLALSKSRGDPKAIEMAESVIDRMERSSKTRPNVQVYTTLIQNYARSRLPDKATKAANVLKRMKDSGTALPNVIAYNAVLNACEHTNPTDEVSREEALKVACQVFDEIRSLPRVKPSHVTYGSFLGVLGSLMPEHSRQQITELVFRRCCSEGQVSRLVLKKLMDAVISEDRYRDLLNGNGGGDDRLPLAWTCNVREVKARNYDE